MQLIFMKNFVFPAILYKLTILDELGAKKSFSFLLTFFHQLILQEDISGTATSLVLYFLHEL